MFYNLKADPTTGEVEVSFDTQNYSCLNILITDTTSAKLQRKVNIAKSASLPTKDLRLLTPYDSDKYYNEVRNRFTISPGEPFVIPDITTSQV